MPTNNKIIRKYQKDDSRSMDLKVVQDIVDNNINTPVEDNKIAKEIEVNGRAYTKPLEGERDYFLIIVITEDEERTPNYFAPISGKNIRGFVIIPVKKEKRGIPPSHMAQEAKSSEIIYGLDYNSGDELYMICDLDDYRIQLTKLNKEKNPNWKLIISNPCVELWFYYHFNNTEPTFTYCKREANYSQQMKTMCGTLKKGGINYAKLFNDVDINTPINNAKKVFKIGSDSNFIPELGSTQMYILMERIKNIL